MNELTINLAKILGPMFILIGFSFIIKTKAYLSWFRSIDKEKPYIFLQGMVEAAIGFALIFNHSYWSTSLEVIISVVGWLFLAEGVLALVTSDKSIKRFMKSYMNTETLIAGGIFMIVFGAYIAWYAF